MQALTRDEWDGLWAEIDPNGVGREMSLSEYGLLCDRVKRRWREEIPQLVGGRTDNRRYVVHLEDCLARGIAVPTDILRDVDVKSEMRYDYPAFPLLGKAFVLRSLEGGE